MSVLDLAPIAPQALSDDELLSRFASLGHYGKMATRRALSLLPEIIRRGLERKLGTSSPYELAQKQVGVSRDVIDKVLRLHGRIGHLSELWGLLVEGSVGWSKLEVIAGIATATTAAWWAEKLKTCSQAELAELVRRQRLQAKVEPSACQTRSLPLAPAGNRPATPETGEQECNAALSGQGTCIEGHPSHPVSQPTVATAPIPIAPESEALSLPLDEPPKNRAITVNLSPEDEALLRAWRSKLSQTYGSPISLGETVALLLRGGFAQCPHCQDVAPKEGSDNAPVSSDVAHESSKALADNALEECLEQPIKKQVPRLPPNSAPHVIEVIVRVAELGSTWLGRLRGILPAQIEATFHSGAAILLGDLYAQAIQSGSRSRGDQIPTLVRKFVALRSGFRCETPGCRERLEEIHHVLPRFQGGTHHPDNLRASCRLHHKMDHGGLFANAAEGIVVEPGQGAALNPASQAFQEIRAKRVIRGTP